MSATRAIMSAGVIARCAIGHLTAQLPSDSIHALSWRPAAIAGAAIAAAATLDSRLARSLHGTASAGTLQTAHWFDHFGEVPAVAAISGGISLAGVLMHRPETTRAGIRVIASVLTAAAITETGKYLVGRVRPESDPDLDGTDFRFFSGSPAFPSGHTATAFAIASSAASDIRSPIGWGLYLIAAGTGWARIREEKHWLSDVTAGAATGILAAQLVRGRFKLFGVLSPTVLRAGNRTQVGLEIESR